MEQALATQQGEEPNPIDRNGLCLLSLDGGGVRGLSTLYILKGLMTRLNHERQAGNLPPAKPCEVFDLIGGTSTGGLTAIMLGRLEMDVDECISAYNKLMQNVFDEKSSWLPLGWTGKTRARFDSKRLKTAIEEVISLHGASNTDLLNNGSPRGCRVFVCTTAKETTGITRLRSYSLSDELEIPATICDAGLATSAATGFFDPVSIGARQFVDGALGANNPVDEVEGEASNIWCTETGDLKPLVKCFISIGTGNPGKKAIEDNILKFLSKTLVRLVTETEYTEGRFIAKWRQHFDEKRYFRFNVDHGLQGVGLAEYKQRGTIESATDEYLKHQAQKFRVRDCVHNLKQKQNKPDTTFAATVNEYHARRIVRLRTVICKACWTVPFARNPRFVGRNSQLDQLEETLSAEQQPQKVAIFGLGGVGKTQIALELAYRTQERYPEYSIFWVPATNSESLQQAYLEIGRQLRIPSLEQEQDDVKKLVQRYLSDESAGRWLLIFDNADDIDMWINRDGTKDASPSLIDYLPQSNHGSLVFTTRSRKVAVKLTQQNVIEVLEMDEDLARQLLRKSLINQDLVQNDQDTVNLLKQLTFLPLALVQAAAYINENGITLSDYLSLLDDQERNVIDLLSTDFEVEGRYRDSKNPVVMTWLISFKQIRQRDPLAYDYLAFLSCVSPRDIPQSLLPPAQSRKKEMDAIGTLSAYSFVSRRSATKSLDIHPLVHLATRNWLRREESLAKWTAQAVTRLGEVFPDNGHENRSVWRLYLPHAQYVLESSFNEDGVEDKSVLLWKFGMCLYSDGRYNEAETPILRVMETRRRVLGPEHPSTLTSMNSLALTYRNQGRWTEAEELGVRVMETTRRVLGPEHPSTLASVANLALTYKNQGRWAEAEELGMRVMETTRRVLGLEHPDTLTSMNNLASTYWNQGRWAETEELGVQVVETRRRVLGPEHPDTLTSMNNLASTYRDQGRWTEAEELQVQVMETTRRVLGLEHPSTLNSMNNLASTYCHQGRWTEAEELGVQVMETTRRVLGLEHPDTLTSMNNLASTYCNQGRWAEAEELGVRVMETTRRVLGPEHPDTLTSMANLASTYRDQGRWTEAEELGMRVMETTRRVLGLEHPDTLASMDNLASTYWNQGRWAEAEELDVQVVETVRRVLGPEHPDTLTSMNNLASTYRDQGRWTEAEELDVQVMETRRRVLGPEHPDTLTSMANLASTYWNSGRWAEAKELQVQVVETRRRVLGPEHPDTLTSMNNLALTYCNQGRWAEAEELGVQVVETRRRVLGPEHPDTLTSMNNLASTYCNQERWAEAEELGVQVVETRRRVLGLEHPDTLASMNNLASTYWDQGRWAEAEELEVQVMETKRRVLGPEHPDTLTSMNNLACTWKSQGRNHEASELITTCCKLLTEKLGADHPNTKACLKTLNAWKEGGSEGSHGSSVQ